MSRLTRDGTAEAVLRDQILRRERRQGNNTIYSILYAGYHTVRACVCACVCVVIPFILDVRLVDAPAGVTQDFSTFLLWCVPLSFSREGFSRSFPSSTVKSILCTNDLIVLHLLRIHIYIYYFFFVRKNPSSCDDTEIRTHVPTRPAGGKCKVSADIGRGFTIQGTWVTQTLNIDLQRHSRVVAVDRPARI